MESIRIAAVQDSPALEELVKPMLGDAYPEEVARAVVGEFFTNTAYKTYVLETAGTVAGFGVLKYNPFEGGNQLAEIVWLAVSRQYHRTGIGTRLVQYLESLARENSVRKLYIKTSVPNKPAVCFWVMQGYQFEARMLDFSAKGLDDYYLGKEI
jgi:N-acetylglutamate synthase-like GNAT family acetyltransferase